MPVDANHPIELLAPTTVATASEGGSVILEMTAGAFRAIRAAVLVALEDPDPDGTCTAAPEVYDWFAAITDPEAEAPA